MAKIKNRQFWESASFNNSTFVYYYNRLVELAISMFEWKGLPESVDPRYLELALFGDGMAVFFKDEVLGELALRCAIGGRLNVYNIPVERRAYAPNGYTANLTEKDSVIIFNNMVHTNSAMAISNFAKRLWDLDRTIDVNAKAQKTPVLIRCSENQRLTMINLYKNYDGNQPVIFGDKGLDVNPFSVLKTDAPYVADKIYELKTQIWNEALTYLGISNINVVKKERLITDEVTRNLGGTVASRYSRLSERQRACEAINKMFGLNISCDYRESIEEVSDIQNAEDGEADE